jgi:hypothetical protein
MAILISLAVSFSLSSVRELENLTRRIEPNPQILKKIL